MHYFDWTATTPMSRHAIDVYSETACKYIGNPSSTHPLGQEAKARLDQERAHIAGLLGAKAKDVYFTSGGTESDSIVLSSRFRQIYCKRYSGSKYCAGNYRPS